MVHQPDELGVAVARQDRAVGVLVVVDELKLEHAPVGQHKDAGLVDELVLGDPDRGAHLAVGSLLRLSDRSPAQQSTQRRPVLLVQGRFDGSVNHGALLVSVSGLAERGPNTSAHTGIRKAYFSLPLDPTVIVFPEKGVRSESARSCRSPRERHHSFAIGCRWLCPAQPPAAASSRSSASVPPIAATTARAFSIISSCSASGSEAATIAPPEPICRPRGDATRVRMTMLRSAAPLTERNPNAP